MLCGARPAARTASITLSVPDHGKDMRKGVLVAGSWFRGISPSREKAPQIDTSVAHPARVYDYWLGGKDNFAADREAAEAVIAVRPSVVRDIRRTATSSSAGRCLAAKAGLTALPGPRFRIPHASPNVRGAVQQIAPECRFVYVDDDPIVLAQRPGADQLPAGGDDYLACRRTQPAHPGRGRRTLTSAGRSALPGSACCT